VLDLSEGRIRPRPAIETANEPDIEPAMEPAMAIETRRGGALWRRSA